jgi:ubiquinone/menaquinone biosynthesis C-methylase UbiE
MPSSDIARHRAYMPAGASRILNARSLETAHRRLAEVLRPGQTVLDVGCGTGAITRQIAEGVVPRDFVVGMDSNAHLIRQARQKHQHRPNVRFAVANIYHLPCTRVFDIATTRVFQWLAAPQRALQAIREATRPHGRVIVLDDNHEKVQWVPIPPASVQRFYTAFLRWRAEAGMDNAMADHLMPLFRTVGFADILEIPQHEVTTRQDPEFATRVGIWAEVATTRGYQMVADGLITETQRATAEAGYRLWMQTEAEAQTLYLLAVEGAVT